MPEQKMSYQERWHKLANEYAIAHGNGDLGVQRINMYYEKDARIAVAAQAEAIRGFAFAVNECGFYISKSAIDRHLLEHGYKPKQEFHCNNKGRHYSDPGYKPVCDKQCSSCAEDYPIDGGYIEPKTGEDGI